MGIYSAYTVGKLKMISFFLGLDIFRQTMSPSTGLERNENMRYGLVKLQTSDLKSNSDEGFIFLQVTSHEKY